MESERRGAAHSAIISLSLIDEAEEKINKGESVKKGIEWRRMIKQQSWVSITYIHHLSQTAKRQTAEGTVQHKQEVMPTLLRSSIGRLGHETDARCLAFTYVLRQLQRFLSGYTRYEFIRNS